MPVCASKGQVCDCRRRKSAERSPVLMGLTVEDEFRLACSAKRSQESSFQFVNMKPPDL